MLLSSASALSQPPPELVTVRGQVLDGKTKQPVSGAIAALRLPDKEGRFVRILPIPGMNAAPTDAQGNFVFNNIPEGEYQLSVSASYYHPFSQKLSLSAEKPPVLEVILTPLNAFTGMLFKPDGAPAAKAQAYVTMQVGNNDYPTAFQTDAEGHYKMHFFAEASHRLLVRVLEVGWCYAEVTTKAGEDAVFDIRLQPPASIAGVVREKVSGKPLTGVPISAYPVGESGSASPIRAYPEITTTTDAEGNFRLTDIPSGTWSLQVLGRRFLNYTPVQVKLQPDERQEGVVITLTPAPLLRCTLLGVNGQPIATAHNATLEVWTRQNEGKYSTDTQQVTVDAQGQFTTSLAQVGDVQLFAFVEEEGYGASAWIKVEEGKNIVVNVQLRKWRRIVGIVREKETNKPVPGAMVKAAPLASGEPLGGRRREAMCDNQGRFVLENMIPATYELSASAARLTSTKPVRVSVGEEDKEKEVVIEVESRQIAS